MTPEEVRADVDTIRAIAADDEAAHSYEDALYESVLMAIALGDISGLAAAQCAQWALTTKDINFARWCA